MGSTTLGTRPTTSRWKRFPPVALLRAAHLRHALLVTVALMLAAALAGRPLREIGLVGATVLVGQFVLGWHNDLLDRSRDLDRGRTDKPVIDGSLGPDLLWFVLILGVLAVVPLAVLNGLHAAGFYLGSLLIGLLGNWLRPLRRGFFSWVPWAASYACYPAFLSWGGWGGQYAGEPPTWQVTGAAAVVGVAVHLVASSWGLADDDADGWTTIPLRLGRLMGATAFLFAGVLVLVASLVGLMAAASKYGL